MTKRILIEGLDLVGKSTICNDLVNNHKDEFIYKKGTYTDNNELYRDVVVKSKLGKYSEETITWLYIAAAVNELDILNKTNDDNSKIIIQDSFFVNRMIGVHAIKERILLLEEIKSLLLKYEKPIASFYIYAVLPSRKSRFNERAKFKPPAYGDKLVFEDEEIAKKRELLYRNEICSLYEAEFVDNSENSNILDTEEKIYKKIKEKVR